MKIAQTNAVAKIAAVVAGLSLVAFSFAFAPAKADTASDNAALIASLQAQLAALMASAGTTTTTTTFATDLTIGSQGASVTALQNWLISKGFAISAGATGYFGAQTAAALASYQASVGITPASGYFGPITRAKVNASGSTTTTTTTTTTTGTLSGGEANLTDYNLSAEDGDGAEGESDVKLATSEFDVEDGDVSVQRAELTVESTGTGSASDRPWDYFDTISVWANGKKLADVDAGSRNDWDDNDDDTYTITITGINYVVKEDDKAELTFAADINDNMDSDDIDHGSFEVYVDTDGIRSIDAAGIQQYVGKASESTNFSFQAEENGDLSLRDSDEDPEAMTLKVEDDSTSDEYTVFAFDVRNKDDADTLITDLTIGTTSASTGYGAGVSLKDVVRKATLSMGGDDFDGDINDDGTIDFNDIDAQIDGDSTETFTLAVEFATNAGGATLPATLGFMIDHATVSAEGVDSGDEVDSTDIAGSSTGEDHTISLTGFDVTSTTSNTASASTPNDADDSTGTFKIVFKVTADEDDATYVAPTAASSSAALAGDKGAVYRILKNGSPYSGLLDSDSAVLTSTAKTSGGAFKINAGATETFTLTVSINPDTAGLYAVELYQVNYADNAADSDSASDNSTLNVDTDNQDFETDPVTISS